MLHDPVVENASRNLLLDMSGNRKRKTGDEIDVYEEYFQNERIYKDWDDLSWMGEGSNSGLGEPSQPVTRQQPNNMLLVAGGPSQPVTGQNSNSVYQGDMVWGGQPSDPSIGHVSNNPYQSDAFWGIQPSNYDMNLNYYPESSNVYHLDDF